MSKKEKGKKEHYFKGTLQSGATIVERLITDPEEQKDAIERSKVRQSLTRKEIEDLASGKTVVEPGSLDSETLQIIGFYNLSQRVLKGLGQHLTPKNKKELQPLINTLKEWVDVGLGKAIEAREANWYSHRVLRLWGLEQQYPVIEEVDRLHKQPRNYLKTTAKLVGKATGEDTLFSLPTVIQENGGNFLREVISRNTAILGNYLLQLWQQGGGDELVIDNLSPIAEIMGNSNYEIKIYLLYLGGYVYPIIDKDENGLTLTTEQLFKIKFRYSSKVAEKYKPGSFTEIGGGLTKFIKDEPIDSITIKPSALFIKAIEGKGLGNVLVVNDRFVKLALSLTDIAYKIFTYSASNKPSQKIAENNLVKHLGLEKQIKTQGRPRVRATILKGLQELQDKGHIKSYSYDEAKGMYVFTYSDKYIRHKDLMKEK